MIRYADRHDRKLPAIAMMAGLPETARAKLAAQVTGRVMEIVEQTPEDKYTGADKAMQEFEQVEEDEVAHYDEHQQADGYRQPEPRVDNAGKTCTGVKCSSPQEVMRLAYGLEGLRRGRKY